MSKSQSSKENNNTDFIELAKYSSIGYYLVAPLLVGVFIGLGLDTYFNTKPALTLIFIGFGFISSMYNLYKLIKEEKDKQHATHKHKTGSNF